MDKSKRFVGAICGDGMCPYLPCSKHPNCKHLIELIREGKEQQAKKILVTGKVRKSMWETDRNE